MEYEPVNPNIRNNVPGYLGCIWQVTKTIPIKLRDIAEDPDFKIALERVHDTLQKRENDANVKLYHNYMDYHENTVVYSNELHLIEQPGQCSKDPDENTSETIDSSIQHNYQSSSTNT